MGTLCRLIKAISAIFILIIIADNASSQTNHPPVISLDFPDEVITKQGVSHTDSILTLPLADFGQDADGDTLIWSTTTEDSVVAFFSAKQETLFVHSDRNWFGRGSFVVRLEDGSGAFDEKEITVTAFKNNGTLLSQDGSKLEYYVPWHPVLDFNRIESVEQHLVQFGKSDLGLLDRQIHWSRWKKLEFMKGVTATRWLNDELWNRWSQSTQYRTVDYLLDELSRINCNWLKLEVQYYMESPTSNDIIPMSKPPLTYPTINNGGC